MDVTNQILQHHKIYGSSESTHQGYVSSGSCFNYSKGNSIQKAIEYGVTIFPFKVNLKGEVGLFGAENVFFKFNINVKDAGTFCLEEPGWVCAEIDQKLQPVNPEDEYTFVPQPTQGQAVVTYEEIQINPGDRVPLEEPGWQLTITDRNTQPEIASDEYTLDRSNEPQGQLWIAERPDFIDNDLYYAEAQEVNPWYLYEDGGYVPAELSFPNYIKNYNQFSVYLENKKTDNIYVDSHVDGRLYKIDREEHPYELMYAAAKDCVYVGIHARNTKRLPFDMTVYFGYETIGKTPPVPAELMSPCCSATATVDY